MGEQPNATRNWIIEINNPLDKGYSREKLIDILMNGGKIKYFCISDEVSPSGTPHVHIFASYQNNVRFETMKNRFPQCHQNIY